MSTNIIYIILIIFSFNKRSGAQNNFEFLDKKQSQEVEKYISSVSLFNDYDNYPAVFSKIDSVKFFAEIHAIRYLSEDTLILTFDTPGKEQQESIANAFFHAEEFAEFHYFIILFGKSKLKEDEDGDLILKKFVPSSGIKKLR